LQDIDSLNHILGSYIATGVNNPKKYPKEPSLRAQEDKYNSVMTSDEQLDSFIRAQYEETRQNGNK